MSRKNYNFIDYGIEEEFDPKVKFNSLISVTVSTIMCIAAKCPLPKSNVETTSLFLSTITDDNGDTPKNIKGFLTLLKNYSGPYDDNQSEKSGGDKCSRETEKFPVQDEPDTKSVIGKEEPPTSESQNVVKKTAKTSCKRSEKDPKKMSKNLSSRISTSKSLINKL